jgi:hypothetical protein
MSKESGGDDDEGDYHVHALKAETTGFMVKTWIFETYLGEGY